MPNSQFPMPAKSPRLQSGDELNVVGSGAKGCVGEEGGEFVVIKGGGIDEPAYIVSVVVDEDGATVGATKGVIVGDLGFG
jgi:hypothetical protein